MDDLLYLLIPCAISLAVLNAAKGKYVAAAASVLGAGIPFLLFATLASALRLARPGSWWYRERHDQTKQDKAQARWQSGYGWQSALVGLLGAVLVTVALIFGLLLAKNFYVSEAGDLGPKDQQTFQDTLEGPNAPR